MTEKVSKLIAKNVASSKKNLLAMLETITESVSLCGDKTWTNAAFLYELDLKIRETYETVIKEGME